MMDAHDVRFAEDISNRRELYTRLLNPVVAARGNSARSVRALFAARIGQGLGAVRGAGAIAALSLAGRVERHAAGAVMRPASARL
jgi:hypothetical protein